MKFFNPLTCAVLLGAVVTLMGYSSGVAFEVNQGYTGAPGDAMVGGQPRVCQSCHNSANLQSTTSVEILEAGTQNVVTSYMPNTVYDVRVTITAVGAAQRYGFQLLSLRDSNNSDLAAWLNPGAGVRLDVANANGRLYAEHNNPSQNNQFLVQWTAPSPGTGSVTFYAGGNAVNFNGQSSGDGGSRTQITLTETAPNGAVNAAAQDGSFRVVSPVVAEDMLLLLDLPQAGNYLLTVNDLQGNLLFSETLNMDKGQQALTRSLAQLPAGYYVVNLQSGAARWAQMMLKL